MIAGLETSVDKVIRRHEEDLMIEHRKEVNKLTIELAEMRDAVEEMNANPRVVVLENTILALRKEIVSNHAIL